MNSASAASCRARRGLAAAAWGALLLAFAAGGCRTNIKPVPKAKQTIVYVNEKSCNVYDFAAATDLPAGAKNIGWLSVPAEENDEQTFIKLREKVCEQGGDALSQITWERDPGAQTPTRLRGNAWVLP